MLDNLPDKYYTCGMDNIFIPEKFLWEAYSETKSKTMLHGVFQQKGRELPNLFVKLDYSKDRKNLISWGWRQRLPCWRGVLSFLILWRSVCMTLIRLIFCLWWLRSWCVTSTKRISMTRQLRKMSVYSSIKLSCKILITITWIQLMFTTRFGIQIFFITEQENASGGGRCSCGYLV